MRLFSLLLVVRLGLLTFAIGLEPSGPLCESLKQKRHISSEEAKEKVGPWFEGQFNEWHKSHRVQEPRFWSWFAQKYAPSAADSILDCKLASACSVSIQ
jgi:hypothetical protein